MQEHLAALRAANNRFRAAIESAAPSPQLPRRVLRNLDDLTDEVPSCIDALEQSVSLIEQTSLDLVDMEPRLKRESTELADILGEIGQEVDGYYFVKQEFLDELEALEDQANSAASALFPSGIQDLFEVKQKLRQSFRADAEPFTTLAAFLSDLATRRMDGPAIKQRFESALRVLGQDHRVSAALRALRIPVFPAHRDLEELVPCIAENLYSNLTGVQAFALLNIASRLRSIQLLDPAYGMQITKVFPDRFYFTANAGFLAAVRGSGLFVQADASLHRHRAGGWKQNGFPQGNVQICHGPVENGRVQAEADIDLYRNPLRHFFGEVLRNHLTGEKTDPYRVRRILDQHGIKPLGGFELFHGETARGQPA